MSPTISPCRISTSRSSRALTPSKWMRSDRPPNVEDPSIMGRSAAGRNCSRLRERNGLRRPRLLVLRLAVGDAHDAHGALQRDVELGVEGRRTDQQRLVLELL